MDQPAQQPFDVSQGFNRLPALFAGASNQDLAEFNERCRDYLPRRPAPSAGDALALDYILRQELPQRLALAEIVFASGHYDPLAWPLLPQAGERSAAASRSPDAPDVEVPAAKQEAAPQHSTPIDCLAVQFLDRQKEFARLDKLLQGVDTDVLVQFLKVSRGFDPLEDATATELRNELDDRGELPDEDELRNPQLEASIEALAQALRLGRPVAHILSLAEAVCEQGMCNALPGPHVPLGSLPLPM